MGGRKGGRVGGSEQEVRYREGGGGREGTIRKEVERVIGK